jgi:putative phosphonate metabolism protein
MSGARYAVYWSPRPDTRLAAFGRAWLGRDAETGVTTAPPAVGDIVEASWRTVVADAALYGFHATLKPPFRLAPGCEISGLEHAVNDLAASEVDPLRVQLVLADLDGFLALVPATQEPELEALAARCVASFDSFRAPPDAAELARRRAVGLSRRAEELLVRWGYPHVMDLFRFHMTLTRRLAPAPRSLFRQVLAPLVADACAEPAMLADLCLFEQAAPGAAFVLRRRFPFASSSRLAISA